MNTHTIPIYRPELLGNEKKYVNECLDTVWISSRGRFVGEFESRFADWIGARHAVSVCNGTTALHLAMLALGIGAGDEVIVPTLTYVAPVNAITYTGATPVFVDSTRDTWNLDPEDLRRAITPRTRAILAVHLYGQSCDMDALVAIAREHRLFLIEDCAEAIGTRWKGQHVGTFGDISTFSFFGNKTITTGEGGMVVTQQKTLDERARHYKGQGLAAYREYWHDVVGYNFRMTNIAAAIGLAQLERVDRTIERKLALADRYTQALRGLPVEIHGRHPDSLHSYWMISVLTERADQRDPLRAALAAVGVETRPVFPPVHTMPMYSRNYRRHSVAEDIAWRGINLPSWPGLSDEDLHTITSTIARHVESAG